jgi:hypothetical protein
MIELRQAGKDEMLRDWQSAKDVKTGSAFSKLQQTFIFGVTEYWDCQKIFKFITSSIYYQ